MAQQAGIYFACRPHYGYSLHFTRPAELAVTPPEGLRTAYSAANAKVLLEYSSRALQFTYRQLSNVAWPASYYTELLWHIYRRERLLFAPTHFRQQHAEQ